MVVDIRSCLTQSVGPEDFDWETTRDPAMETALLKRQNDRLAKLEKEILMSKPSYTLPMHSLPLHSPLDFRGYASDEMTVRIPIDRRRGGDTDIFGGLMEAATRAYFDHQDRLKRDLEACRYEVHKLQREKEKLEDRIGELEEQVEELTLQLEEGGE